MRTKIILGILALLCILGVLFWFLSEKRSIDRITTFDECIQNGFPANGLNPSHCTLPDGRVFDEIIEPPTQNESGTSTPSHPLVSVDKIKNGQVVTSPLTITGKARGYWYFEASFPVELLDAAGKQIAAGPAQAQGDWMTEDFVPFTITLNFENKTEQKGTLVLHKDNPSGLSEREDTLSIPVVIGVSE